MAVITISRLFGAGGRTLGERLAERLSYRYINEDMIKKVAAKCNVSPDGVYAFEKQKGSKIVRFMDKVVKVEYIDRLLSGEQGYLNEARYVRIVSDIITEIYNDGNAVIIGRGGQFVLRNKSNAFHLGLVADNQFRIEFVMNKHNLSHERAKKLIRQADSERATFLKCFGEENYNDPRLYHLIMNTARISMDKAEQLILELIDQTVSVA